MLVVNNLTKKYGKFTAVNNLTFKVDEGSIFGFVGPNGAGKTSTLKVLATLLKPTSGRAWIAGEEVTEHPERIRRLVGYMPDFFGVYDDLKVDEYLDFYAASYRIPADYRKNIINDLLELVDLAHKKAAYVDTLSRGMKQRLCLARCLVHEPALLILDEPASGLDPRARVEIREILRELKAMGKTIIVSSHILHELSEICTHMGIIEAGEMVITGTVDEIMNQSRVGDSIEIRVLSKAEEALSLIQGSGLNGIITGDNVLQVAFEGTEEAQSNLLAGLVQNDIPVSSFAASKSNLEEIFMRVTKGVVR
ncbi:MAG: ABC transporter ATP-binding protein [Syntrophomonadaceae bacterium]|nr:ABC transporter ATP-binding protein [Syntrophomonadaceae bacterium]MDD3888374.1 ABC transporter ATP-binding protein [Syntrophomonadaceae bacterium]MDD4548879.1 ABC transporter ATP-binding protein [Syntrophomonadaceae bacterium]